MDGKKADMVFTDPPYNVDYEGYTEEKLKIEGDKTARVSALGEVTSKRDAAIAAGYSKKDASTRVYRLSKKAEISLRMEELQAQAADKAIENATKLDGGEKIGLITVPIHRQRSAV